MGVIVPTDDVTVNFVFSCVDSGKLSTFGLGFHQLVGSVDEAAVFDLLDDVVFPAFSGAARPLNAGFFSSRWTWVSLEGVWQTEDGPITVVRDVGLTGTRNEDPIPINCAFLVTKSTARGGRKGKGRQYWPPFWIAEDLVNAGGQVTGAGFGLRQTGLTEALTDITTLAWEPVLHHSDGTAGNRITGLTIQTTIGTQRRRLR
jgi:hypothetical protein